MIDVTFSGKDASVTDDSTISKNRGNKFGMYVCAYYVIDYIQRPAITKYLFVGSLKVQDSRHVLCACVCSGIWEGVIMFSRIEKFQLKQHIPEMPYKFAISIP